MDVKKKSFLVYGEDLKEILDDLTDEQVGQLFRGMVSYHNTGVDPHFTGALKYVFIPIRQQMDRDKDRYEQKCEKNRANGRLGGRPRKPSETEWFSEKPKKADIDKDIDIEKDTDRDKDKESRSVDLDVWSLSLSVLSHLNSVAGTQYKTDDVASVRLISDLAHKGYTEEQMLEVIDKKAADWLGDPKVEQYLRPSTLFGTKFEQYLNQPDSARKKEQDKARSRERAMEQTRKQVEIYERRLTGLRSEYDAAAGNMPLRLDIKGRIAVCEAELESLRARIGG
jgi:uncharacterized phage protein (TIGR02220 family)